MDLKPIIIAELPAIDVSLDREPIYDVGWDYEMPESTTNASVPSIRDMLGNHDISASIMTSTQLKDSVNTIDIDAKNVTISNPLEFRNIALHPNSLSGNEMKVPSHTTEENLCYQVESQQRLGNLKPTLKKESSEEVPKERRRSFERLPPRKNSIEDFVVFSKLGFPIPEPTAVTYDVEMSMEMEEQKILDAMSQLQSKHQKIMDRKTAEQAKQKQEEEARKVLLNHVAAVETQIKTIDVLRAKLFNDRTRDAAENILFDASKSNRERDALTQLLALAKHRIATRQAYIRFGSLFLFFLIYSSTVLVQRDPSTAFGVESRQCVSYVLCLHVRILSNSLSVPVCLLLELCPSICLSESDSETVTICPLRNHSGSFLLSSLMDTLPLHGAGGPFDGGSPGSTGLLSTDAEFYTWLGQVMPAPPPPPPQSSMTRTLGCAEARLCCGAHMPGRIRTDIVDTVFPEGTAPRLEVVLNCFQLPFFLQNLPQHSNCCASQAHEN